MPQNKNNPPLNQQAGNVFVIILIAVFLFGALIYSFSRSANQGTGNISKQQAKLAAQEILNYAKLTERAVDRLRRNGCSETEISFANAVVAGYSYNNGRGDEECHIFSNAGGNMDFYDLPDNYVDSAFNAYAGDVNRQWGEISYTGENVISGAGTTCSDRSCKELLANIHFIDENICVEINRLSDVDMVSDTPPPENTGSPPGIIDGVRFIGAFDNAANGVDHGAFGASSACLTVAHAGSDYFYFYHILLER